MVGLRENRPVRRRGLALGRCHLIADNRYVLKTDRGWKLDGSGAAQALVLGQPYEASRYLRLASPLVREAEDVPDLAGH